MNNKPNKYRMWNDNSTFGNYIKVEWLKLLLISLLQAEKKCGMIIPLFETTYKTRKRLFHKVEYLSSIGNFSFHFC